MSWDCTTHVDDNKLDIVDDGVNLARLGVNMVSMGSRYREATRRTMTVDERRRMNTGYGERQHMEMEQSEETKERRRREVETL